MLDRISLSRPGVTLVELLVVMGMVGVLLLLTVPHLLGSKEKTNLGAQVFKLVQQIEITRQQAVVAKEGKDYRVIFTNTSYSVVPDEKR